MSDQINYRRHGLVDTSRLTLASADLDQLDLTDASFGGEAGSGGRFPSLDGATAWLNSPPLTPEELRGKVVAVDFWTYTCINWLRTLPSVRAWDEQYRDHGLVVLGVHTPEFPFEHDLENVRSAVKDMRVAYPVAVDNDYAVWSAFNNHYWPALYLIDAQGRVRHHQFGEGDYDEAERVIQRLLAEAGDDTVGGGLAPVDARGPEVAADWDHLGSGETYLGYERADSFASPEDVVVGAPHRYSAPARLGRNEWALTGEWTVAPGFAALSSDNGRIAFRFHARDAHLVMGAAQPGTPARFRVLLDGQPAAEAHGSDVDERGEGAVREPRLYQLIRQPMPIVDRLLEIEFLDAGVQAYAFTFG
jgi:thiol-disulfide isomerase/thioredoxin